MKIAIMQPYFMPHIGYFQLINEVDKFIFYDDVNYIKGGWVNRNYMIINKEMRRFTIPLKKSSSFKLIKDTYVNWESIEMKKLIKTFNQNIKKENPSKDIINTIFDSRPDTISDMSIMSIKLTCEYLGVNKIFKKSSEINYSKTDDRVLNIVNICNIEGCNHYINPEGGQNLYDKKDFLNHNINLNFIKGNITPSMIEILNDVDLKSKINNYKII